MPLCERFYSEFHTDKLAFKHERELDFVESAWKCIPWKLFVVYRFILASVLVALVIFDFAWEGYWYYKKAPAYWLIYATNWAFFLFVVTQVYLSILTLIAHVKDWREKIPGYEMAWLIHAISYNAEWVTSLVYWLALSSSTVSMFTNFESQIKHSLPAMLSILDIMISAIPIRLAHTIYPVSCGLLYTLFNMVYSLLGGTGPDGSKTIYPNVDWTEPGGAVTGSLLVVLVGIIIQGLLFLLSLCRSVIAEPCMDRTDSDVREPQLVSVKCYMDEEMTTISKTEGPQGSSTSITTRDTASCDQSKNSEK